MNIEDRGVVYDASRKPKHECVATFPSLCMAGDGTLFSTFQVGSGKHALDSTMGLCRSRDGGRTWQEIPPGFGTKILGGPRSFACGELIETAPGKLLLVTTWFDRSKPEQPVFDPSTEGLVPCATLAASSADEGETWSARREIPMHGLRGCSSTGPFLRWDDGRIAFAFESYREYNEPNPRYHGAWLLVSKDGGGTFDRLHSVAQDPSQRLYFWDQRLCVGRKGGKYVAMFWTHDRARQRDLPVHMKVGSIDDPEDSSVLPVPTTIPGQISAPLWLDDGRLLAFVVDRGRPSTLKLWCSRDKGTTWPENDSLLIYTHEEKGALTQGRKNINFSEYWEDMGKWSFGMPALRDLGDGRLLLTWYAGTPDRMSIHWARVRVDD